MTVRVVLVVTLLPEAAAVAANEPIDPRVRLAIAQWPETRPRGAVSTFCAEHGISRKSFYEIRKRARADGPAAVLEPRTRRPRSSPSKLSDEVKDQALAGAGRAGGLRAGPRADQRARQDARDGPGRGAVDGVAGADLPRGRRGSAGAEEEAPLGVAAVRLPGAERVLATRRDRVRADRRTQVRDLPAHRRPLPLRGRLPRRLRRDLQGRDRRVRQGAWPPTACRSGCCPTTGSRSTPHGAGTSASSWRTLPRWASRRSPASRTSRPRRARTNASTRPCSATSTSSPSPTRWPNCRPRSTRSTTSTTPNAPTKGCPGGSPRGRVGSDPEGRAAPPQTGRPFFDRRSEPYAPRPQPPADLPAGTRVRTVTSAGTITLAKVTYIVDGHHALPAGPRRHEGDHRRQDHRHRPRRRDPHRTHPTRTRHHLRRQRPTPRTAPQEPANRHRSPDTPTVTDVLIQNCHPCPETSQTASPSRTTVYRTDVRLTTAVLSFAMSPRALRLRRYPAARRRL